MQMPPSGKNTKPVINQKLLNQFSQKLLSILVISIKNYSVFL